MKNENQMTDQELQDLIRLKSYEQPEEGYFDAFLEEFQQRQRSEMLKTSARGLFMERVRTWFSELGAMRWAIGAGAAYAAVALTLSMLNQQTQPSSDVAQTQTPALSADAVDFSQETIPVSVELMKPVDFSQDGQAVLDYSRYF